MFSRILSAALLAGVLISSVTALTVGTTSQSQSQSTCSREYTVVAGDDCDSIGASQQVSNYQLRFVNPTIDPECTNLAPGQAICLGITGEDCTETTVVTEEDVCLNIANSAGITGVTFLHNNPNVAPDCSNIRPKQVLCTAPQFINYKTSAVPA